MCNAIIDDSKLTTSVRSLNVSAHAPITYTHEVQSGVFLFCNNFNPFQFFVNGMIFFSLLIFFCWFFFKFIEIIKIRILCPLPALNFFIRRRCLFNNILLVALILWNSVTFSIKMTWLIDLLYKMNGICVCFTLFLLKNSFLKLTEISYAPTTAAADSIVFIHKRLFFFAFNLLFFINIIPNFCFCYWFNVNLFGWFNWRMVMRSFYNAVSLDSTKCLQLASDYNEIARKIRIVVVDIKFICFL